MNLSVYRRYRFFSRCAGQCLHGRTLPLGLIPSALSLEIVWYSCRFANLHDYSARRHSRNAAQRPKRRMLLPMRGVPCSRWLREIVRFKEICFATGDIEVRQATHAIPQERFECRTAIPSPRQGRACLPLGLSYEFSAENS
jgi:hypothetical protein